MTSRPSESNHCTGITLHGVALLRCSVILLLLISQSFEVTGDFAAFVESAWWIVRPLGWGILFAIAGQTLAVSAARHRPVEFVRRRLLRSWIPYAAVISITALAVGPIATSRTVAQYFRDGDFWSYLLNLLGWPRFVLPGLFEGSVQARTVNGVLWCAPVYLCVAALALAASGGASVRRMAATLLPAAAAACTLAYGLHYDAIRLFADAGLTRAESTGFPLIAMLSGIGGIAVGGWSPDRRQRRILATAILVVVVLAANKGSPDWSGNLVFCAGVAVVAVCLVRCMGARERRWDRRLRRWTPVAQFGLLLGFPVQQLLATFAFQNPRAWPLAAIAIPLAAFAGYGLWISLIRVSGTWGMTEIVAPFGRPGSDVRLPKLSREWWLDRTSRLLKLAMILLLVAMIAGAVIAVVLVAFQVDPEGM